MEVSSLHKKLSGRASIENRASESKAEDDQSCGEEMVLQVGSGIKGTSAQEDDFNDEGILNKMSSSINHKVAAITKTERSSHESESRTSYISSAKLGEQVDDQLESAKAEMEEIMEENQRLKLYLDRVMKDYRTLQLQYRNTVQQEVSRTNPGEDSGDHGEETDELIDLSLGMSSRDTAKKDAKKTTSFNENTSEGGDKKGLTLALDCKFEVPTKLSPNQSLENSTEEAKEEIKEMWQTKGSTKSARDGEDGDEISQQNPSKRARVSVRVRCDTPTMSDGCQWRKYGQKIAKGNPCPRAYYRCTVAPSCPVRKQVQRCADDMSILIITYEGTHNHPLSVSATAMASTTSAAASMLLSGSSTSGTGPSLSSSTTSRTCLNGLNLYLSNNSRSKPFYLPNTSISTSPACPTITLDLTSTSSSSTTSALTRLGSFAPRDSSTSLNFSTLDRSNPHPLSWSNGMLSYGTHQVHNKNPPPSSLTFGSQSTESLYQSYLHKVIPNPSQQSLPQDTIVAATKAITSDPSFQSALAVALSSIIGSGGSSTTTLSNHIVGERSSQVSPSMASDSFPILSSFPSMFSSPNKKFL